MKLLKDDRHLPVPRPTSSPLPTGSPIRSKLFWSRVLNATLAVTVVVLLLQWNAGHNPSSEEFADAMQKIRSSFVEPVDDGQLYEHALEGMVARLDQYSEYIPPEDMAGFEELQTQEFGGIGIQNTKPSVDSPMIVLSPYFESPAYRAGIRAGDRIYAIDGVSTIGMTRNETSRRIRGKPGEPTTLTIQHAGEEQTAEVTVTREVIVRTSVLGDARRPDGSWDYRLQADPRIEYLRIESFGKHTPGELKQILSQPAATPPEAIILDLSGNAGGLLSAAVEVCDMFVDHGAIVTTRGRGGEIIEQYHATASLAVANRAAMAVLVNKYSASASEVVAACLQDHGRAVVIGDRTWGKGSVQSILGLKGRGGALKLTTATYWRPSGHNIHRARNANEADQWGVKPNAGFEVHLSDDEVRDLFNDRRRRDVVHGMHEYELEVEAVEEHAQTTSGEGEAATTDEASGPGQAGEQESVREHEPIEDRALQKATEYLQQQLVNTCDVRR